MTKHLWKPGQSGNPSGKPKMPEELRSITMLTKDETARLIAKYGRMTKSELTEAIQRHDIPMIELTIASIYAQAAKGGDFTRMAFLLDRTIGKVENEIVVKQRMVEELQTLSDDQLLEMAQTKLLEAKKE